MKLLHTADIHLGSNAYGRIDASTGLNTRLIDAKKSFAFMVEHALKEDIDLFLFCGDAYRTADPTPTQQKAFVESLKPISDAGIPIVMIVGNHDHPVSFGKASALDIFDYLSDTTHVFHLPEKTVIETKSGPLQLIALPWPIRSRLLTREEFRKKTPAEIRTFVEERYTRFVEQAVADSDPALPTVLAAHLTVQGAEMAGSEQTSLIAHEPKFMVGQLAVPGIDYVALGHIHRFQDRNADQTPPVVYSGSIECISFKEWDQQKGFVIVDINPEEGNGRSTTFTFVPTPARPFLALSLDLRGSEDPTAAILDAIKKESIDRSIVRLRYQIEEDRAALIDYTEIRDALRTAETIAGIERVVDAVDREKRTQVTRESSVEDALRSYIAQHENLVPLEDSLLEKAYELQSDTERLQ